jgi:hypothetical protein
MAEMETKREISETFTAGILFSIIRGLPYQVHSMNYSGKGTVCILECEGKRYKVTVEPMTDQEAKP